MKIAYEDVSSKIYFDSKLDNLPSYYNRDIVKLFLINPKLIFVLWGISQNSFDKLTDTFACSREDLKFRLIIHHKKLDKSFSTRTIILPPFTNNWFVEFQEIAKDIKAEIVAYTEKGNSYSLLHSAEIHLPSKKPSLQVNSDWVHPDWKIYSEILEIQGEAFLSEKKNIEQAIVQTPFEKKENNPFLEKLLFPDGSSGLLGSSGNLSSSTWKKENE